MSNPVATTAAALVTRLSDRAARRVLRALVRDGEEAALMRLRGALGEADPGDLADPGWREALFDAIELRVSPELDDDADSVTVSKERAA